MAETHLQTSAELQNQSRAIQKELDNILWLGSSIFLDYIQNSAFPLRLLVRKSLPVEYTHTHTPIL